MQNNTKNKHEILLGLTTTPKSDWRGKVKEMKKYGIKRIALFPTFLKFEQRKELYNLLETVEGLEIPHVHLRGDMNPGELDYFVTRYQSKIFNLHPVGRHPINHDYAALKNIIFIENNRHILPSDAELEEFAGLCIDFSHLENSKLTDTYKYNEIMGLMKKHKIGCAHVSAVRTNKWNPFNWKYGYDRHWMKRMKELDYIGQYRQYLPYYVSLELENSFANQLEVKKYLEQNVLNK
jgi:hypothetical protein